MNNTEEILSAEITRDLISIIVPCYNEEKALPAFYRAVTDASKDIDGADCEFIFVDDGSRDSTPGYWKASPLQIPGADTSPFPAISEKKPPCMQGCRTLPEITVSSWMRISSTRRNC